MAENILVKEALTDEMIEAGAELIASLDRQGWPPAWAFWMFDSERNDWRLILRPPDAIKENDMESYQRISNTLRAKTTPLSLLADISVRPDPKILEALGSGLPPGWEEERGRRLKRTALKGVYIDDVYLYRRPQAAPAP
jgi:hypothetical protein